MDGYGTEFWLRYHLADAFRYPKCPNVPREVFAKARQHVLSKRRLKTNKAEQQIPSRPHIVGQFCEERQDNGPLCGIGNQSQLSVKNECSEVSFTVCICYPFSMFLLICDFILICSLCLNQNISPLCVSLVETGMSQKAHAF